MKKILIVCLTIFLSIISYSEEKIMSRIRLTFNNQEIVVGLDDNSASRSLLNQLPLDLKFENYGNTDYSYSSYYLIFI